MVVNLESAIGHDARREPRTSLFVMATLYSDSGSAPVKVRDMSSQGALIEGGIIPPAGTNIRLSRGSLTVAAEVVWCRHPRAGLRFESSISVDDWLPRNRSIAPQQRVDEMVQRIKASEKEGPLLTDNLPTLQSAHVSALELTRLRIAIESLAEDLSSDPDVLRRHIAKLQTLDLAAQVLTKLASAR